MKIYTNVAKFGNKILHRGYDKGHRIHEQIEFQPTLFVPSAEPTGWRDLRGHCVAPIHPGTIKDCVDFVRQYSDVSNYTVYGNQKYHTQFIHETYPWKIDVDSSLIRVCYIDIETEDLTGQYPGFSNASDANHSVVTIAVVDQNNKKTVFGLVDYSVERDETYYKFTNEMMLLNSWMHFMQTEDFDIITGWNVKLFDVPYLVNRINKLFGDSAATRLSPWKRINEVTVRTSWGESSTYNIVGLDVLDYMDVFIKFGYVFGKQESYALDFIANLVLGERKLDYSEYGSLRKLYSENPQKHTAYCLRDTELVKRMEDKLAFLKTVYSIAYLTKSSYTDTLKTTPVWDSYIYGELLKHNIAVPPEKKSISEGIDGAYVKEVSPCSNGWLMTFDAASLYPSVIMQHNISPETIGDRIPNISAIYLLDNTPEIPEGFCLTGAGQLFRTDVDAVIPRLVRGLFNQRKQVKKLMLEKKQEKENFKGSGADADKARIALEREIVQLDSQQQAIKILMNSLD